MLCSQYRTADDIRTPKPPTDQRERERRCLRSRQRVKRTPKGALVGGGGGGAFDLAFDLALGLRSCNSAQQQRLVTARFLHICQVQVFLSSFNDE